MAFQRKLVSNALDVKVVGASTLVQQTALTIRSHVVMLCLSYTSGLLIMLLCLWEFMQCMPGNVYKTN